MVPIKSAADIKLMKKAGAITAKILDEITGLIKPGASTGEINEYAESRCNELGVRPAFKGYRGYPAALCMSINEEVVHGIPSKKRFLTEGDIIGIDFGVIFEGWHGDSARTYAVGNVSDKARKLLDVTRESLSKGIGMCRPGNHLLDIGYAVQNYVEARGYSVVREFVGHGIGRSLHEAPQVPNFGKKGGGIKLLAGMVLAIEPMVNVGGCEIKVLDDGWTAITKDMSLSAHFEHTVAITQNGPEILTIAS